MWQIILFIGIFLILIITVGRYLYHIATSKPTFADPLFDRLDGTIYRLCGINKKVLQSPPNQTDQTAQITQMNWKQYLGAMLLTNAFMMLIGGLILSLQTLPIFNPNQIGGMKPDLAFNTIISFMTNTNLQHYAGESDLSYLSQMAVITFMMFMAAATGYAVCMAFVRGLAGKTKTMGNFYVDLVRIITRVLLPLALILGLVLIVLGVPQNLSPNLTVETLEGTYQDIAMGPVASLEIIKHLGTNGGGFFGANSAMPFENPNVLTNMLEMLAMMLLPGSCVIAFGHMVSDGKKAVAKEAQPILAVMAFLFIVGVIAAVTTESAGNPLLAQAGLGQEMGNMEGKEVRFGIHQSALFTTVTTAFTTGSVNNMHDTLTPLGGAVPLTNMMLNLVFGGKGAGLMNMIMYAILAVFICGLMIGRTPEYLGKKIEGREMKLTAIGIIIHPLLVLCFSALAVSVPAGLAGISNPGYHGLTQILYEYTSAAANNGSGFEGLIDNTVFWNLTTGLVMLLGRFLIIALQLAIAGSLMEKVRVDAIGTLKTTTPTFAISLLMVVIVFAALNFFPALVLGPVAEHLTLMN
jgi:K+-transporting ATPase ATPase A chain